MAQEVLAQPLSDRFEWALVYATRLHRAQSRKGTTIPYASHLLAVASIALEHGATEDEAIAALLHDAIEDQGGDATGEEIRVRFGDAVHAIVVGCSDATVVPKPPWRERKERYLRHVRSAPPSVKLVSAADKLHNARSVLRDYRALGEELWSRFNAGREESLWYYRALVEAFCVGDVPPGVRQLVDELDGVVRELEVVEGRAAVPKVPTTSGETIFTDGYAEWTVFDEDGSSEQSSAEVKSAKVTPHAVEVTLHQDADPECDYRVSLKPAGANQWKGTFRRLVDGRAKGGGKCHARFVSAESNQPTFEGRWVEHNDSYKWALLLRAPAKASKRTTR